MSRTYHLTHDEFLNNTRPTRQRARTRLTKDFAYPNVDRPMNNGSWPGGHGDAGRRRRQEHAEDKVLGRRRDRRRRNREQWDE